LRKVLVIRFSSIGDIVLTTPVVRALKQQVPGVEIHYVTKSAFAEILQHNPAVGRIHVFRHSVHEVIPQLRSEKFDLVVDLHQNIRSLKLKLSLGRRSVTFNKINFRKFLAVNFKMRSVLPQKHIVDRYFDALSPLGIVNDGKGLEYHIPPADEVDPSALFFRNTPVRYIALVIGGSYHTKKIPLVKLVQVCEQAKLPVVLIGGKEDKAVADELRKRFPHLVNCSGLFNIGQSASVIRQSEWVITSDTGMMHIAAAFKKKIISVWGNTIPGFGMYAYQPGEGSRTLEVKGLRCRPCSKLGFGRCPRGHFRCMMDIDYSFVAGLD
jgi:ADP-heptose:LPS heptosyltransferase